jgi:hypothetical protein
MQKPDDDRTLDARKTCDECDTATAINYCKACDQDLCQTCDTKIHNKGKRA